MKCDIKKFVKPCLIGGLIGGLFACLCFFLEKPFVHEPPVIITLLGAAPFVILYWIHLPFSSSFAQKLLTAPSLPEKIFMIAELAIIGALFGYLYKRNKAWFVAALILFFLSGIFLLFGRGMG